MQSFDCTILDERLEAPIATVIMVEDLERACELVRRLMDEDSHHLRAELRLGGTLVFTAVRTMPEPPEPAPPQGSWVSERLKRFTRH